VLATLAKEDIKELLRIGQGSYPGKELHLDHFAPLSTGGFTTRANLHALPAELNLAKGNKSPQEAYKQLSL